MATTHQLTDAQIQQAVIRELRWDSRVEETDVGVEVDEGVVTLTGTVGSWTKKLAAQEAAHHVAGVLDVANDVQVRPPGLHSRTDADIARAIRQALEWDIRVPHEQIQSTVSSGWVKLEGRVDSWRQREDAEHTIRHLDGVVAVTNDLHVTALPANSQQVRDTIEEALERRATREANRIDVVVREGTVTLSGRVHTWLEKRAILGAAGHAPGVREVVDHLRVDPYF
jgi:osmotically-inducible protein OsmY